MLSTNGISEFFHIFKFQCTPLINPETMNTFDRKLFENGLQPEVSREHHLNNRRFGANCDEKGAEKTAA